MASPLELASSSLYTDNIPHEIGGGALDVATLKALYKFNTGALTTDSSGESHTLTDVSDPAEGTGMFGTCAVFDDNDAYSATDHADFKPTGSFSVSFWFKTSTASTMGIFQAMSINTNYAGWRIGITSTGYIYWHSGKNTGTTGGTDYKELTGAVDCNDGVWHHAVCVWDGTNMYTYIDGRLDNSVAWANAPAYAATNYIRIGCFCNAGTNSSFYTGSLDDVAFWNGKALTQDEVLDIYGRLEAYYRFSTGAAIDNDSSYHGHTLVKVGNPVEVTGKFGSGALFGGMDNYTYAWYKFSAGALTTDSSGSGYTLTAISDPAENASGKFGGAVALDGNDAYSRADHANWKPTGAFSVSGWIKANKSASNQYFFQSGSINTNWAGWFIRLSANTGYITFFIGDNTGASNYSYATSTTDCGDNAWHHFVATYDGSTTQKIYIDGVLEYTRTTARTPAYAATNYVRIGCVNSSGTNGSFLTGSLDDLVFYNGEAFNQSQVDRLFDSEMALGDAYAIGKPEGLKLQMDWSVGFWIKGLTNPAATNIVLSFRGDSANVNGLYFRHETNGYIGCYFGKNTGTTDKVDYTSISGLIVVDTTWHFVVVTFDGTYLRTYNDGIYVGADYLDTGYATYPTTIYPRIACSNIAGTNNAFSNTYIDDFFVFNDKVLTGYEIASLYTKIKKIGTVPYYQAKKVIGIPYGEDNKIGGIA